jgi:hypothetical protein
MSILGSIKNRFFGRSEDISEISDIRSHVIGGNYEDPYRDEGPITPQRADVPELPDVSRFGREPVGFEPGPMPERGFDREPISVERDTNRDYDIADKLNIIEAQLSAIRSQTETINERLKNLEMRIGRRY